MKKTFLFGMAMIGSLAFCACSNNEEAGDDVNPNDAKQIISLAVANSDTTTRVGRPLLSSEANQTIENVVVYVVDASSKEVKYNKEFSDWQNESVEYGTNDGKSKDIVLETNLDDGNYQIFAVGFHSGSRYSDIENTLVSGSTFNENAVLSLTTDEGAEEILPVQPYPSTSKKPKDLSKRLS